MDTHAPLVSTAATRRTVIAAGAATVVTVAAPDVAEAATAPKRARFEKLVGETFEATLAGRTVKLRLDAVEDGDYRPRGLTGKRLAKWRRKSFVLVFTTRATISQGQWSMRSRRSGRFPLFIVPDVPTAKGRRATAYATFNGWRG